MIKQSKLQCFINKKKSKQNVKQKIYRHLYLQTAIGFVEQHALQLFT